LGTLSPGENLTVLLKHHDGTEESFEVKHTYNQQQVDWVMAGSALNKIRKDMVGA
jgi:aconitate hydratase